MIETVKMFQVNKGGSSMAGSDPKCLNSCIYINMLYVQQYILNTRLQD